MGQFFVATTSSSIMDVVEIGCVIAVLPKKRKERRKRRYRVHPVISHRLITGQFYTLYEELRTYPDKFASYRVLQKRCNYFDRL